MPTGEIEILAESVEVFNVCRKLPFEMKDFVKVSVSCYMYVHRLTNAQAGDSIVNNPGWLCFWLYRNRSLCGCSIATWTWGPLRCRRTSGWDLSWWWRWENISVMCTVWRLLRSINISQDSVWLVIIPWAGKHYPTIWLPIHPRPVTHRPSHSHWVSTYCETVRQWTLVDLKDFEETVESRSSLLETWLKLSCFSGSSFSHL